MPATVRGKQSSADRYRLEEGEQGTLTVFLADRLDEQAAASLISYFDLLLKKRKPHRLILDLSSVSVLDDFGVAVLAGVKTALGKQGGRFMLAQVPPPIDRLLAMHQFATLGQQPPSARHHQLDIFTQLGDTTLQLLQQLRFNLIFLGDTFLSLLRIIRHPRLLRGRDTLDNMRKVGVDALPIVGLISFLLGLIMAFMSSVQLQQFGANIYVASLVSLSMTRELGPIMTAIIVAGRSGSAFAAEIGSMKISEEVDALFTMGIDPHVFLVLPRLIAALLTVPLLTLFSDVFAILGGLLVGVSMLDLTVNGYISQTIHTLELFDVFWGFSKAALFALIISWTGCLRGFQVRGGAAGVGQATTSAVVSSIFMIILSDSILVVILRYWEG